MPLTKLLDLCFKHGLLCKSNVENNIQLVKLGSTGLLLHENVRNQWIHNMVTNRDCPIFLSKYFQEAFNFAKTTCSHYVPFGLAEVLTTKESNYDLQNENSATKVKLIDNNITLKCTTFVDPSEAISYFHQWQRQRRMWWRKISASPGRYSFTDIQNVENNQEVKIVAQYLWGKLTLETITLYCNNHPKLSEDNLQVKFGRKKSKANYIVSDVCQSTMLLNTIYDAFEEPTFQGKIRPIFRFHRKMAPFKISFAITQSNKETTEELKQLATYLCKKLRTNNVSSLLLPSSSKVLLEQQFLQYDELGVPYTIMLNESTLKNGIAYLRSRDTTLKEQVHVADIPNYVEELLKNF